MKNKNNRDTFSKFGFLMAAVGSAIGLGNLWKFPYVAGKNGGGIFVLVYLVIVLTIGFTCTLGEMTIGRKTKLSPIGAYAKLAKKYTFVGVLGVLTAFLIVTYYNIIGGWIVKYLVAYISGQGSSIHGDPETFFNGFISDSVQPIIWTLVFVLTNVAILMRGVKDGIEKASKIMMPTLFVLLIIIAIRSCTLPGAAAGIEFFLKPDFSKLSLETISLALGQCFFSLSLGMGIMITYGSYVSDDTKLEKSAIIIPLLDTFAALLAGFAILPAVFAFGFEPGQGPGLIFVTLPAVFESMPGGQIIGILFFVLVLFAAVSSSMSLLEVPIAYFIDNKNWSRKKAVLIVAIVAFCIAIPESISLGSWETKFFGQSLFDFVGYIAENLIMPMAGFFMCIVMGYVWKPKSAIEEITNQGTIPFTLQTYWTIMIKFVAPVGIFIIWLQSSGVLGLFK